MKINTELPYTNDTKLGKELNELFQKKMRVFVEMSKIEEEIAEKEEQYYLETTGMTKREFEVHNKNSKNH